MHDDPVLSRRLAPNSRVQTAMWIALAVISCSYIAILNGGPLFYYDSFGYLDSGIKTLRFLGLVGHEGVTGSGVGGAEGDGVINGSRSAVYSVLVAGLAYFLGAVSVPIGHLVMVIGTSVLMIRVLLRAAGQGPDQLWSLTALTLLAASLGSLPFFVAYFMPDILLGLMTLVVGLMTVFWTQMRWWELLLSLAIGVLAVLSHPSHLLISALLVPLAAIGALWIHGRRFWVSVLLIALLPLSGAGERMIFGSLAKQKFDAEVTYFPFLTARLIQDRVGYEYLARTCPDETVATCALYDVLQLSDNPARLTASHIIFEFSSDLASFQKLHPEIQGRIAAEQVRFALWVGLTRPIDTGFVVLRNTLLQARMNSIRMTIPEPRVTGRMSEVPFFPDGAFSSVRLSESRGWIASVESIHKVYYVLTALGLVGLFFWPGRLSPSLRVLVLMVLAGILANAFVCGAFSQPAHRYGSRAIWLLPYITILVALLSWPSSRRDHGS